MGAVSAKRSLPCPACLAGLHSCKMSIRLAMPAPQGGAAGPRTWLTVICPSVGQNKGPGQPSEPAVLGAVRANRPPCRPSTRAVGIKSFQGYCFSSQLGTWTYIPFSAGFPRKKSGEHTYIQYTHAYTFTLSHMLTLTHMYTHPHMCAHTHRHAHTEFWELCRTAVLTSRMTLRCTGQ